MNARIHKEIRGLRWPVMATAVGAFVSGIYATRDLDRMNASTFHGSLNGIATLLFVAGVGIVASTVFGSEFRHNTLLLLGSQPVSRFRIWLEKLGVSFVLASGAVLFYPVGLFFAPWLGGATEGVNPFIKEDFWIATACFIATFCSITYWTLFARSSIGGFVFSITNQMLAAIAVGLVVEYVIRPSPALANSAQSLITDPIFQVFAVAWLIYCILFLQLSWKKFSRFEFREASPAQNSFWGLFLGGIICQVGFLRSSPRGLLANLIRKELRLQKPVFTLAAVLTASWVAAIPLLFMRNLGKDTLDIIFVLLTVIFAVVSPVLTAIIAITEEKRTGTVTWHHALPASTLKQLLTKIFVGLLLTWTLGVLLPFFLSWVIAPKLHTGFGAVSGHGAMGIILFLTGALFILSCWASAITTNAVHAALAAVGAVTAALLFAAAGNWFVELTTKAQSDVFQQIIARLQTPPYVLFNEKMEPLTPWVVTIIAVALLAIIFRQLFLLFRLAHIHVLLIAKYSTVLTVTGICCACLLLSWQHALTLYHAFPLRMQLEYAIMDLQSSAPFSEREAISLDKLIATGKLSPLAVQWLRNSSIIVSGRFVWITFPKGETDSFHLRRRRQLSPSTT